MAFGSTAKALNDFQLDFFRKSVDGLLQFISLQSSTGAFPGGTGVW
jgi:hypothetical protein